MSTNKELAYPKKVIISCETFIKASKTFKKLKYYEDLLPEVKYTTRNNLVTKWMKNSIDVSKDDLTQLIEKQIHQLNMQFWDIMFSEQIGMINGDQPTMHVKILSNPPIEVEVIDI